MDARELKPAAPTTVQSAGAARQTTAPKATKGRSRTQQEQGWISNFMPSFGSISFNIPRFDMTAFGALPKDKKTTEPRSSLTGIPQVMTFEQQLSGGLPVVGVVRWRGCSASWLLSLSGACQSSARQHS
jgi:hypothetical protein